MIKFLRKHTSKTNSNERKKNTMELLRHSLRDFVIIFVLLITFRYFRWINMPLCNNTQTTKYTPTLLMKVSAVECKRITYCFCFCRLYESTNKQSYWKKKSFVYFIKEIFLFKTFRLGLTNRKRVIRWLYYGR